jgi:hypothetical protein
MAPPSGVRSAANCCGALRSFGVEAADPETHQRGFHAVDDAGTLADQLLALAVRTFRIFLLQRWDRRHAAVLLFPTQPAEEGTLQQCDIQPIGLRTPVLSRHRYAGWMNDIRFDRVGAQPSRQPKTVAASLEGNNHSRDLVAGLDGFVTPAM